MMVIGIDPGQHTGMAVFESGRLVSIHTETPLGMLNRLRAMCPHHVVFEDSRLQSHAWTQVKSRPAALKMARNVGEIDGQCKLIVAVCEEIRASALGISPKNKGAKMDHDSFCELTGWDKQTNQHGRDAAMVAWPYRKGWRNA